MKGSASRDKLILDVCDQLIGLSYAEREALLNTICADSPRLRRDIETLLDSIENSGKFMALDAPESEA